MADMIRWGILGTGSIAKKFADAVQYVDDAELVAVGSRTAESAARFAANFNIPRQHASYQALADDPDVDAIYVATPHNLHMEDTILCLNAGKAVLCEKPLAINAAQAEAMVAAARNNKRFMMEAMWTRFQPLIRKMRAMLKENVIGDVRMLAADFGFRATFDERSRLLDPALGGGGLLDVGVYCVSFANMILGEPTSIASLADIGQTGVDEQSAALLGYDGGRIAITSSGVRTSTPVEATIMGTEGSIRLHAQWFKCESMTVYRPGKDPERIDMPTYGNGFNYEIEAVNACLKAGELESSEMTWDESIAIMRTMDRIRAQWGLKYPME